MYDIAQNINLILIGLLTMLFSYVMCIMYLDLYKKFIFDTKTIRIVRDSSLSVCARQKLPHSKQQSQWIYIKKRITIIVIYLQTHAEKLWDWNKQNKKVVKT